MHLWIVQRFEFGLQDGSKRMAFAPIAGALGPGLTLMALYQQQTSLVYGMERSGISCAARVSSASSVFNRAVWAAEPSGLS